MAVTQTIADRKGLNPISILDATDSTYQVFEFGPIYIIFGSGSPDGVITAPWGSEYTQLDAATYTKWVNVDGATEWKYVTLT